MIFEPFPKMARLFRDCRVTEKIDGSNAQIAIVAADGPIAMPIDYQISIRDGFVILAGSRTRWLQPTKSGDNYGFARWVRDHEQDLIKLGEGHHFGEWWGAGINRAYGFKGGDKFFSLFNAERWGDIAARPACCSVVPTLYHGPFGTTTMSLIMDDLRREGSRAAPGFMRPEGIVVWHEAARTMFKATLEKDEAPKSMYEFVKDVA